LSDDLLQDVVKSYPKNSTVYEIVGSELADYVARNNETRIKVQPATEWTGDFTKQMFLNSPQTLFNKQQRFMNTTVFVSPRPIENERDFSVNVLGENTLVSMIGNDLYDKVKPVLTGVNIQSRKVLEQLQALNNTIRERTPSFTYVTKPPEDKPPPLVLEPEKPSFSTPSTTVSNITDVPPFRIVDEPRRTSISLKKVPTDLDKLSELFLYSGKTHLVLQSRVVRILKRIDPDIEGNFYYYDGNTSSLEKSLKFDPQRTRLLEVVVGTAPSATDIVRLTLDDANAFKWPQAVIDELFGSSSSTVTGRGLFDNVDIEPSVLADVKSKYNPVIKLVGQDDDRFVYKYTNNITV